MTTDSLPYIFPLGKDWKQEELKDVIQGLSPKCSQPAKHHTLDQEIFFSSILQKKYKCFRDNPWFL